MTVNDYEMPDDLIRQKEWTALTDAEKEELKEFAADEAEYNLLRRMLLAAAAQPGLAQGPGPEVEEKLKNAFAAEKKRRGMAVILRYAAAAAVLVAIAVYVFWQMRPATPANNTMADNKRPVTERATAGETAAAAPAAKAPESAAAPAAPAAVTPEQQVPADSPAVRVPVTAAPEEGLGTIPAAGKEAADLATDMDAAPVKSIAAVPVVSAKIRDNEGLAGLVSAVY